VRAVSLPVTVKTRLGWDQQNKNIMDIALNLQDCGIAALAIHGRTRCQLYRGKADWSLIGEVKNDPRIRIPIIGNGDITDGPSAKNGLEKYGVDGIMIGRAAIGNPWVFREVKQYLLKGEMPAAPDLAERLRVCRRHIRLSAEWKGEKTALFEMRRHYCNYFKGIPNFKAYRMKLVTAPGIKELYAVLDEIEATDFSQAP